MLLGCIRARKQHRRSKAGNSIVEDQLTVKARSAPSSNANKTGWKAGRRHVLFIRIGGTDDQIIENYAQPRTSNSLSKP